MGKTDRVVFSPDELARRRVAWEILSRLFLDTDFDDKKCRGMADELKTTGYSKDELTGILNDELGPLLYTNLKSVAGEWTGFDPGFIEESIGAGRHLSLRKWYRFVERRRCNCILREVVGVTWRRLSMHLDRQSP